MGYKLHRACRVASSISLERLLPPFPEPPLADEEGQLQEQIRQAVALFERVRAWLEADSQVEQLLSRWHQAHRQLEAAMEKHQLGLSCAACDAAPPHGSCCARGLEEKVELPLLLVNQLLGVPLPLARARDDSCYFLGSSGCRLAARALLCIEYLCPALQERLGHEGLRFLMTESGNEIETTFLLEQRVIALLRDF